MKKIIVDEELLKRLEGITEDFELCDASGRVLAVTKRKITPEEWAEINAAVSDEELDRIANSTEKWYTTEEVLDHLRSL